ncbi:hypothetical protein [Salana multivorans]
MGFFTKNDPPSGGLAPLTEDRVAATFDRRGEHYGRNDSGQIGGFWDGHLYFFYVLSDGLSALQVRSRWNRDLSLVHHGRVLEPSTTGAGTRSGPRSTPSRTGRTVRRASRTTAASSPSSRSTTRTASPTSKLDEHIACSLGTIGQFFDYLDEQFPEEAARAKAEQERQERERGA